MNCSVCGRPVVEDSTGSHYPCSHCQPKEGLRDRFAMAALPAVLESCDMSLPSSFSGSVGVVAERCYKIADAMLKERDR